MFNCLKKSLLLTVFICFAASSAFAAAPGYYEKFYAFSTDNDGAVAEVNYYLERGASVKNMQTVARVGGSNAVISCLLLEIPKGIVDYKEFRRQNK